MNVLALFEKIRFFVFDIDGVLTDGMLHVKENGELLRRMNIKDGYALQLAVKKGYKVWIISGGRSTAVQSRLDRLGITEVYIGVADKKEKLRQLMEQHHTAKETVLYMGDDMPDMGAMQLCGLKCCPQDAVSDIRSICDYIAPAAGGLGCARDVIEKVLKLNDDWE